MEWTVHSEQKSWGGKGETVRSPPRQGSLVGTADRARGFSLHYLSETCLVFNGSRNVFRGKAETRVLPTHVPAFPVVSPGGGREPGRGALASSGRAQACLSPPAPDWCSGAALGSPGARLSWGRFEFLTEKRAFWKPKWDHYTRTAPLALRILLLMNRDGWMMP